MIRYKETKPYRDFSSIEAFKKWWNLYKTENPNANPDASLSFLIGDRLFTSVNDVLRNG